MTDVMMNKSMMMNRIFVKLLGLGLLMLFHVGCSSRGDQPELGTVTGTITLDSEPLAGVAVVFQPDNGRPSRGMTDSQGKYELTYIRQTKGAKVGPHRVEIAPSEEGEVEEAEANAGEEPEASAKPKSGKRAVPARYNVKSELKADVKSGANTFDFALES